MIPQLVQFPEHLFPPEGAKQIDIRAVCSIEAGSSGYSLLKFTCPQGAVAKFTHYAIFNDGLLLNDYEFLPLVNGSRVFPYHGTPVDIPGTTQQKFLISLGLAPNLSNANLINGNLSLSPGQTIEWIVKNLSAVETVMGVRMVGYFDPKGGVSSYSGFGG